MADGTRETTCGHYPYKARGLCGACYLRLRRAERKAGIPVVGRVAPETTCGHYPYKAKGLCSNCYQRMRYVPTPLPESTSTCGHYPHLAKGKCQKCYKTAYYAANHGRRLEVQALYRLADPEGLRARNKAWRKANPDAAKRHKRTYYLANTELQRARSRAWRQANPEKAAARYAAWVEANPERAKENQRRWYMANAERIRESRQENAADLSAKAKARRKAHPEFHRADTARRRARKYGSGADLTNEEWADILAEHDFSCAYCSRNDVKLQMEHMTPLSRGGGHTASNVVPACGPCNGRKATKTAEEFLKSIRGETYGESR